MPKILYIFLLSLTPISELRLSIPFGILHYKLNPFLVFFVSVIGNLIPPILILFFFKKISDFLSEKSLILKKFFQWLENRTEKQKEKTFKDNIKNFALSTFIGIPLPFTGAWTGALIAILAGFKIKDAIFSIFLGVLMAAILVTILTMLGIVISSNLNFLTILGLLTTIFIVGFLFYKKFKTKINF
ncbi:MAG: COG2426 family protein [Minisyncoccia bacterium]